jgi:hypothetical protein
VPSREVFDTLTETKGERLKAYKEGDQTHIEYSNGVEIDMQKTSGGGQGGNLKEVRTVMRTKTRRTYY